MESGSGGSCSALGPRPFCPPVDRPLLWAGQRQEVAWGRPGFESVQRRRFGLSNSCESGAHSGLAFLIPRPWGAWSGPGGLLPRSPHTALLVWGVMSVQSFPAWGPCILHARRPAPSRMTAEHPRPPLPPRWGPSAALTLHTLCRSVDVIPDNPKFPQLQRELSQVLTQRQIHIQPDN